MIQLARDAMDSLNRNSCVHKDAAWKWLRRKQRPDFEALPNPIKVVDLFSGCGGMTLGIAEAAFHCGRGIVVRLAVDVDERPIGVLKANFPHATAEAIPIEALFSSPNAKQLSVFEKEVREAIGPTDFLVGGPPCQGHSDLNNYTRRADDRNYLYAYMAQAAKVLRPKVVIIENVPAIVNDRSGYVAVYDSAPAEEWVPSGKRHN